MPYSGSIQVVNDANGAAFAFLADNGLIWQCVWNAQAERWEKAQPVPGAEGGRDLQVLVLDDLFGMLDDGRIRHIGEAVDGETQILISTTSERHLDVIGGEQQVLHCEAGGFRERAA